MQIDQRDQHEDRAEEGIDEELQRRVDAARAAPDTDDDEHRDQHRLEEYVEQQRVSRRKDADQHALKHEHGRHVLRDALVDRTPRTNDDEHAGEGGQDNQGDGNAIDGETVVGLESIDPQMRLAKLHAACHGVIAEVERKAGGKREQGNEHAQPARDTRIAAEDKHEDGADNRQPDQDAEKRPVSHGGRHSPSIRQRCA